ncbi:ferredoxin [Catelliglobosispora koreensis]|uniref:ferredoxin n=1 Tax=Catelliglobosispora koreensis TaxID=129052 RepID=UPI00037CF8E1|nr:ferredoxin [Catelliglobosispora koreensis]
MRVVVEYESCDSNGLCAAAAPEVFEVRSDDFLYVLDEKPPPHLWPSVEQAARACPKLAITLEDA